MRRGIMKKLRVHKKMKYVRVDCKTIIEVPADIPDEQAIRDFLELTRENRPSYINKANDKWKKD